MFIVPPKGLCDTQKAAIPGIDRRRAVHNSRKLTKLIQYKIYEILKSSLVPPVCNF